MSDLAAVGFIIGVIGWGGLIFLWATLSSFAFALAMFGFELGVFFLDPFDEFGNVVVVEQAFPCVVVVKKLAE